MKKQIFFICLLLSFYTANAQTVTIHLKPGAAKGEDVGITTTYGCTPSGSSLPWEFVNSGSAEEMYYIDWTFYSLGCSHGTGRCLLRFTDMDTIPPGHCLALSKAELNLFAVNSSTSWGTSYFSGSPYPLSNQGWVERVTGSWSESTVTWSTQPSVTTVNRVGIPNSTARWGWSTTLDVTTLVKDILASGTNNGFRVSLQTEAIYRSVILASSDNTDSTLWPELILYFDTSVIASPDTSVCIGETITLHASGADTFSWSPAAGLSNPNIANPSLTVTSSRTYVVEGRSKGGCISYDTVNITAIPVPTVNAGRDTFLCADTTLLLHASGADTFIWSPATGLSDPRSRTPLFTPAGAGIYSFIVEGRDATYGCKNTDTINITAKAGPSLVAGPADTSVCIGKTIRLYASGADAYLWTPVAGLSAPDIANPELTITATTTTFTLQGKNSAGCRSWVSLHINPLPLPVVTAGPDTTVCFQDTVALRVSGADAYHWTPETVLIDARTDRPLFLADTTREFIVEGTSAAGCKAFDTVRVTVGNPLVTAGPDTVLCPGTRIQLYARGAETYRWSPATGLDNSNIPRPTLTFRDPISYIVEGTDQYGCLAYDTVTLNAAPLPDIIATADKYTGCFGDTLRLNASGGISYSWAPPTGLSSTDVAAPLLTIRGKMAYVVSGKDTSGCTGTDTLFIDQYPVPNVHASALSNKITCTETEVILEGTGALSYSWAPAVYCDSPLAARTKVFPRHTLVFTLTGTDINGCKGLDTVTVFYEDKPVVHIPNAFTPNGDGLNDRIRPLIFCDFHLLEFAVFNRWGQQVFRTGNTTDAWDGTFNGMPLNSGTYYYLVKGVNSKDEPLLLKGDIILIR